MKIGSVLLIVIAAFLALPAHGADSDSAALRKCIQLDDEMTVHYNCKEPATLAFCYEEIVMKQDAADIDIKLAKGLHCQSGYGFHDPCYFFGQRPGKCHNIEFQAWAKRIASYTAVFGVCPDIGNIPEWVSNPGSNGQYTCDPDPMEGIGSDRGSDGSAEMLSENDLYEILFGEYENSLSALLDGDLSSTEILGMLLVELLGGELSFDDALGNMGKKQVAASDQRNSPSANPTASDQRNSPSANPTASDQRNSPSANPTASEYERALGGLLEGSGSSTGVLGDNGAGQVVTGGQQRSPSANSNASKYERALGGLLEGSGSSTGVLGDNGARQVVTGGQRSSPSATSSFSAFDCKSSYGPHSSAMNIAMNRLEAAQTQHLDTAGIACANANQLRVGLWFMEYCNKSSLNQTEKRQLAAQIKIFRDAVRHSISTYNAVNAGSDSCECQSDISNYCMD